MNAWEEEMGGGLHGDGPSGSGFGMAPRTLCLQPHNLKPPLVYLLTDWQKKKKALGVSPLPTSHAGYWEDYIFPEHKSAKRHNHSA